MKRLHLSILFVFSFSLLIAQEIVPFDKLYLENELIYEVNSGRLFTGNAGKIRKNGHIVYKDVIEEGKIIKKIAYYNRSTTPAIENIYYKNSGRIETQYRYDFKGTDVEIIHFNKLGEKILSENYENEILIYSCEFLNNRKHGKEFCINKQGKEITIEYKNGKKLK